MTSITLQPLLRAKKAWWERYRRKEDLLVLPDSTRLCGLCGYRRCEHSLCFSRHHNVGGRWISAPKTIFYMDKADLKSTIAYIPAFIAIAQAPVDHPLRNCIVTHGLSLFSQKQWPIIKCLEMMKQGKNRLASLEQLLVQEEKTKNMCNGWFDCCVRCLETVDDSMDLKSTLSVFGGQFEVFCVDIL